MWCVPEISRTVTYQEGTPEPQHRQTQTKQTQGDKMNQAAQTMPATITGRQLADARSRARLTQRELAELLRHSERAVQQWELNGVAPAKVELVRSVLGAHLAEDDNPLATFSDMALLAEIAKRLDAARRTVTDL